MIIPYQYNKMAAGGITEDQETHARTGVRGVFTFLANGRCNQSAMTMYRRFLDYRNVSRMEVSSGGLALNTTLGYYGTALIRSGGTMSGITVNSKCPGNYMFQAILSWMGFILFPADTFPEWEVARYSAIL